MMMMIEYHNGKKVSWSVILHTTFLGTKLKNDNNFRVRCVTTQVLSHVEWNMKLIFRETSYPWLFDCLSSLILSLVAEMEQPVMVCYYPPFARCNIDFLFHPISVKSYVVSL